MDELNSNAPVENTVSKKEIAAAVALYPIAYIYTLIAGRNDRLWFGIFVLLFVLLVSYVNRGTPAPIESWVWLGSMAVITLCVAFSWGRVWDYELSMLFVHCLAVWWTLSRSGKLLEGKSGHLFPADVFNGLFRIPFGNFFLRIRILIQALRGKRGRKSGVNAANAVGTVLALICGAVLLYSVTDSLAAADLGFNALMVDILAFLTPNGSEKLTELLMRFLISLPVAAWLFGLIVGSTRAKRTELDTQSLSLREALMKIRIVPERIWTVCAAAFSVVYLLFFVIQGSYLFGAFFRSLPEGFTVAEYARQGFFELCRVMAINFALLWLITRSGTKPVNESRVQKIMCTLLLAAGMLFAVVAISKLGLYISCFGFTPKRLQSTWLALLLLAGAIAAAYSLWSGKKSFQYWLIYAALSLTLLHLF